MRFWLPVLGLVLTTSAPAAEPAVDAVRKPGQIFRDCPDCPEMVIVPKGRFTMGTATPAEMPWAEYGLPAREVRVRRPFAIGRFEVTFAEWDACVAAGGCTHRPEDAGWGRGRRPVINVNWADAMRYVAWLRKRTRRPYRLPSEAEWEYVARAGTTTARYWGDGSAGACRHANVHDRTSRRLNGYARPPHDCDDSAANTAPVGQYLANAFGLFDTFGNVLEWIADCWYPSYEDAPRDTAVWTKDGLCNVRMVRGGSWGDKPFGVAASFRGWSPAEARDNVIGFRVARPLQPLMTKRD